MATKSLIINSTAQNGKKLQKSITNVNPACSNEDAGTFAQKLNALTTNTYQSAGIVKKMDVTEEEEGGSVELKLTTSNICTLTYEEIEGGYRVYGNGGDKTDYVNITIE